MRRNKKIGMTTNTEILRGNGTPKEHFGADKRVWIDDVVMVLHMSISQDHVQE